MDLSAPPRGSVPLQSRARRNLCVDKVGGKEGGGDDDDDDDDDDNDDDDDTASN